MFKRAPYAAMLLAVTGAGFAGATDITFVPVGHPGNIPDTRYGTPGFGFVDHVFLIGRTEVTARQYCDFLNAVAATDPYGLYNPDMWSGTNGCKIERLGAEDSYTYTVTGDWAQRPVNYVSWGDAVRFANWLANGRPNGPQGPATTEDGSYFVNGAVSIQQLMTVTRAADATCVIPTVDEWYKAAYHANDGVTANYFDYPTETNVIPSNQVVNPDPGNHANFYRGGFTLGSPYWRTPVGEFENTASPYGTRDQGGNVWEWTETPHDWSDRFARGGSYASYEIHLRCTSQIYIWCIVEDDEVGFRIAWIPPAGDLNCDGTVDNFDINPSPDESTIRRTLAVAENRQGSRSRWGEGGFRGGGLADFFSHTPFSFRPLLSIIT